MVAPNISKDEDNRDGIYTLTGETKMPATIDMINGFFESRVATCHNPLHLLASPSLYNSRIMMEIVTIMMAMIPAANVASRSLF
jgi:hypothetical protein